MAARVLQGTCVVVTGGSDDGDAVVRGFLHGVDAFLDSLVVDRFIESLCGPFVVAKATRALPPVATTPAHLHTPLVKL
jgi:hypothetical protein